MAIQQVAGQVAGAQFFSDTSFSLSYQNPTTSGDLLVLLAAWSGSIIPTVSDNVGNSWTKALSSLGNGIGIGVWFCPNCQGGANHAVTLQLSAAQILSAAIDEFSGAAASQSLTGGGGGGVAGTPTNGKNLNPPGGMVLGGLSVGSSAGQVTPTANWTDGYTRGSSVGLQGISYQFDLSAGVAEDTWSLQFPAAWRVAAVGFSPPPLHVDDEYADIFQLQQDW